MCVIVRVEGEMVAFFIGYVACFSSHNDNGRTEMQRLLQEEALMGRVVHWDRPLMTSASALGVEGAFRNQM